MANARWSHGAKLASRIGSKQANVTVQSTIHFVDEAEMKRRSVRKWLASALFSMGCLSAALASEWKSEKDHFSVELPAGWNEIDPPRSEVKVAARKPDDMWTVLVMTYSSGGARELTPTFLAGTKKGYEAKGGHIKSQRFFKLNGRATGELDGRLTQEGIAIRQQMRVTIIDNKVYQMLAIGPADEELDPAVNPFFDSFRPLTQSAAAVPASSMSAAAESTDVSESQESANRIAYLTGRVVGFIVGLGLVFGVVVMFVFFVVKMATGKRTPPIRPPNFS